MSGNIFVPSSPPASRETESDRNHFPRPLSNINGPDRYIQSIVDHANDHSADPIYHPPRIPTNDVGALQWGFPNPLLGNSTGSDDYGGLDEFDRQLLGQPVLTFAAPSNESLSRGRDHNQRLSLPSNTSNGRSSRVLGDASHHFRPFEFRDPNRISPFQESQYQRREPHDSSRSSSIQRPLSHGQEPRETRQPSSLHGINTRRGPPGVTPSTQPVASSSITRTTPSIYSSSTTSSPPIAGLSSPLSRVRARPGQLAVGSKPSSVPRWGQNFHSNLDHAPQLPPIINNTRLVDPRQALPDKFRAIFPYKLFNAVQSRCFPLVYGTDDNIVISAPTGSGKTAILEIAICKLVASQGGGEFKIVYQAPTKSLCSERARDWEKKFSHMNMKCVELTGDTTQSEARRVGSASIIVTTPEKWDSITRKWKDHRRLLELVRLVLIDEVHILKDSRGATLEAVVSRMKTIGVGIRFVALSATVPNIDDVALWLGRDHKTQHEPARFEVFGEELRPVKLQRYVYGYDVTGNDFIFDKKIDGKLTLLLSKHSERKPIIVFCPTRKSCERTAHILAEWWSACRAEEKAWPQPTSRIPVVSRILQEIIGSGVAYHHAGLDVQDRSAIETNYLNGQLHVICCTTTLAVGVNLPCHTVVLKGTWGYSDNGPQEYSDIEVMQMLGRAGRPQFDNSAVAIIMTRLNSVKRYERLISGEEVLESTLHLNLVEHINSEIGLGTIQDLQTAKQWINGTFLSVRVCKSPALYDLDNVQNAADANERMKEWCERDVRLLQDYRLYGQAMSRYMMPFETMKLLISIPRAAQVQEMLATICQTPVFRDIKFKPVERALFRELNKSPLILHPIRETVTLPWHKVFLIIQISIGGVEIPTDKDTNYVRLDFLREKRVVFERLNRLLRCVTDCKASDGDGLGTKTALELVRSVAANAWEDKPTQLSQIPGFGPVSVRKWIGHGVHTVLSIADKSDADIERLASRNPPFGRDLLKTLENFPRLTLKTDIVESRAPSPGSESVSVTVRAHLGHSNSKDIPCWNGKIPGLVFMAMTSDGVLAYLWRGNMRRITQPPGLALKFPVALTAPNQTIDCHFSCEEIVGTLVTRMLEPNIPAMAFNNIRRPTTNQDTSRQEMRKEEEDYGDISDDAMLEVPDPLNNRGDGNNQQPSSDYPGPLDDLEVEEYPDIDEVLSREDIGDVLEPGKMDNGKWMCNHHCRNGGQTKSGKPCNHRCCREGVDICRKPPTHKTRKDSSSKAEDMHKSMPTSNSSLGPRIPPRDMETNKNVASLKLTEKVSGKQRNNDSSTVVSQGSKRRKLNERESLGHINGNASAKRSGSEPYNFSDEEWVDFVDLSEEKDDKSLIRRHPSVNIPKRRPGLLIAHEEVLGRDVHQACSPRSFESRLGSVDSRKATNGSLEVDPTFDRRSLEIVNALSENENSDANSDTSDFPDIETIIDRNKNQEKEQSNASGLSEHPLSTDETLYPGLMHTLRESTEYGLEHNLSFTTVSELSKASQRLDRSLAGEVPAHTSSSSPQLMKSPHYMSGLSSPSLGMAGHNTTSQPRESTMSQDDDDNNEPHMSSSDSSSSHQLNGAMQTTSPAENGPEMHEPAWLSEFDPELIDSLRGIVEFVD
ncbi:P-loop containing nucleoside triphosphate hydrolase protein [Xylariaceae sp. FL1019]|nr:P-loop containing nucleoside triphosphate hydrolase protein [Xylariaceae sp. FL1019]